MHVCLSCVEFFGRGTAGGFGKATRIVGRGLADRGVRVSAVVPRGRHDPPREEIDGIEVHGFPRHDPLTAWRAFRAIDADVYHSQEPSLGSWLAHRARPDRAHVVTCRDPRTLRDWAIELRYPSKSKLQVLLNAVYEDNPLAHRAVRRADEVFCASPHLREKVRAKYRLERGPRFLPTPVEMPDRVRPADRPTVCFVSRWDRRKRPRLFFELARRFPDVRFIAAGRARDPSWERALRRDYAHLPNLDLVGFVDQFRSDRLTRILSESWILVGTAAREGLPNAFIEAAAHGCAVLSAVDPGGFASRFGHHVHDDDFAAGLATLLERRAWRDRGRAAARFVRETFALDVSIDRHLEVYEDLRAARPRDLAGPPDAAAA